VALYRGSILQFLLGEALPNASGQFRTAAVRQPDKVESAGLFLPDSADRSRRQQGA
jgi:hypothetical protein